MQTSEQRSSNSEQNLNSVENIQEELKADFPSLMESLPENERESLKRITGTIETSGNGRLTAKEKRVLAVQKSWEKTYLMLAMALSGIPELKKDGVSIAMQTPAMSESHAACCRKSDAYLEFMEKMLSMSVFIGLATSHMMLGAMIASNHGINVLSLLPWYKPAPVSPEQKPPELSEEDRAMIFINLMNRQQAFETKLAGNNP
jgi:hypothetical protein